MIGRIATGHGINHLGEHYIQYSSIIVQPVVFIIVLYTTMIITAAALVVVGGYVEGAVQISWGSFLDRLQ